VSLLFETENVMAWTAVKDAVFQFLNFISFDIFISTKKNSPPPKELPFDHGHDSFLLYLIFDLLCLTTLSAIFQLYHGDQF
jgi:hypothetical protein